MARFLEKIQRKFWMRYLENDNTSGVRGFLMKHIFVINTIGMGYEGISSVILNYLEHMDRENLDLHIAVFPNTDRKILERISKIGRCEVVPERNNNLKEYIIQLCRLLKTREFDVVHIHGNSGTMFLETFKIGRAHV